MVTNRYMSGMSKTTHTLAWDGDKHVVTIANGSGSVSLDYEDFLRIAERLIIDIIEPGNDADCAAFRLLRAAASARLHPVHHT